MNRLLAPSPRLALLFLFLSLLCNNASAATAANSPGTSAFSGQLEQLLATGQAGSTGEPVRRRAGVRGVYVREPFRPLRTPEKAKQREIPAATVNFLRYADGQFPYTVRQDAGADNALGRILAKGETETLVLKEPVPIVIFYWTAQGKGGEVWFNSDPYQGDRLVLQVPNGP